MKTFVAALLASVADGSPCLCAFDVDSTLISWSTTHHCPDAKSTGLYNSHHHEILRAEGNYRLSATGCSDCYMGIISAGSAGTTHGDERKDLVHQLKKGGRLLTEEWNPAGCENAGKSPLITSCRDKPTALGGILKYYKDKEGIEIADEDVHFFDDQPYNIVVFEGTPYHAKQVSCGTTGGTTGGFKEHSDKKCAASFDEVHLRPGIKYCCSGAQVEPSTSSVATTQCGTPCHFPFKHDGKTYNECTSHGEVAPWCATKSEYDSYNWGYCHGSFVGNQTTSDVVV